MDSLIEADCDVRVKHVTWATVKRPHAVYGLRHREVEDASRWPVCCIHIYIEWMCAAWLHGLQDEC